MRLGYFAMPLHPLGRSWRQTLAEDRAAVVLADVLGYYDAFIGEHLTDVHENITNSLVFLATLISETHQIKLGTGTTNLSQQHPVLVAANSAMFDHLANGRFILGVSPGVLGSDAEALGILDQDRNKVFADAIDIITAIWESEPPYDLEFPDNQFPVSTRRTLPTVRELPAPPVGSDSLAELRPGQAKRKPDRGPLGLANRTHYLRRRLPRGRRTLWEAGREKPLPLLLLADAYQNENARPPRTVQDRPAATG
jgi:Luciferase-like monooxygenase